jgi:hypothetical protein
VFINFSIIEGAFSGKCIFGFRDKVLENLREIKEKEYGWLCNEDLHNLYFHSLPLNDQIEKDGIA